jgi:hypothetical protein
VNPTPHEIARPFAPITERIRDKIAASKRKGLWVGGMAPMGYDANPTSPTGRDFCDFRGV